MLRLENLIKDFARVRAVDTVNLHVRKGEIFGLLGPGGSGKTTLVRLVAGILRPTYGRILVGGISLTERPRYAKWLIGYVPDQPFFYERLSGREFIEFHARLFQIPQEHFHRQLAELASHFEIYDLLDERIEAYSQSAKFKVALISALIRNPSLILLDEPLAGLDAQAALVLMTLLRQRAASGAAVFLTTHAPAGVQDLCTRAGILNNGKLIADGDIADLYSAGDASLEAAYLRILREYRPAGGPP